MLVFILNEWLQYTIEIVKHDDTIDRLFKEQETSEQTIFLLERASLEDRVELVPALHSSPFLLTSESKSTTLLISKENNNIMMV